MNSERREQFDRWIDAYLEGGLDASQRAEFETLLAQEPELREEFELQQQIDASVGRLFSASSVDAESVLTQARQAQSSRPVGRRTWRSYAYAAAASLLIVTGTGWWYWNYLDRSTIPATMPKQTFAEFYQDAARNDFVPDWKCADDKEFAILFFQRFGSALVLAQAPTGIDPLGLCYTHTITPRTMAMTFKVNGKGVVVFVEKKGRDTDEHVKQTGGLHLFQRNLEHLVLYEVTPLDHPTVLDMWSERDIPDDWKKSDYREPPRRPH